MNYYTSNVTYPWFIKVNDEVFDAAAFNGSYDINGRHNCLAYIEIKYDRYKVKFLGSQAKQLEYNYNSVQYAN